MMLTPENQPERFLIIQTASIGDVILATPLIEKIHEGFPQARIDFLLKKGNETLFENHPYLNRVLIWDKSNRKYKNFRTLIKQVTGEKYDVVVNVQRFASSGLLTFLSGASITLGFDKNPFSPVFSHRVRHTIRKGNLHETERNLLLLEPIGLAGDAPVILYPGNHHHARMSQYKTVRYITVSPASLWYTKQFPEEKWVEFIRSLDPRIQIYFLGSAKDVELCQRIIRESGHANSLILAGKISFLESASLMKDAVMNFMNDSAPLHLASAVNARTTAIFCSTVPEFGFGPTSVDSAVIQTKEKLSCRPCGLHGRKNCPEKHFKCALTIDTRDLSNRINT